MGAEHLAEAEKDGVIASGLLDVALVTGVLLVGLVLAPWRQPQLESRTLGVGLNVEIVGDDAPGGPSFAAICSMSLQLMSSKTTGSSPRG
jgi:hypothetical protein